MDSNGLHERIKAVRKSLTPKVSQTAFAEMLGTTRRAITTYETGVVTPTDTFIQLLCAKFNISEAWLRTGEGEMRQESETAMFSSFARQYNLSEKEQHVARYLLSLSSEERQQILHYLDGIAHAMHADDSAQREAEKRDQAHRMLDAELDAEQKGQSASTSGSSAAKMA